MTHGTSTVLSRARRQGLSDLLGGHTVEHHLQLADRICVLAHGLLADDATHLRASSPGAAG